MNFILIDPSVNVKIFDRVPNCLTAMKLMDKVKDMLIGKQDLFSISVKESKLPYVKILATIKECAIDNFKMVAAILGTDLTNEIINFQ